MERMHVSQLWTDELDHMWWKLLELRVEKPAMAEMLQLNEQRRKAHANAAGLHDLEREFGR